MNRELVTSWLEQLQDRICSELEQADGKAAFITDNWRRSAGGGGRSRVMSDGAVIEKGGVMYSAVSGAAPEFLLRENAHSFAGVNTGNAPQFFAAGVSIVIHPHNPFVPIIHMNTRYFELCGENGTVLKRWFGGGIDLTPHYVNAGDARYFHEKLKSVCDHYRAGAYDEFRQWADDYFFIRHRNETRGIGGIFFDKLGSASEDLAPVFEFWKNVGSVFAPVYRELISRNRDKPYSERHKRWQLLRRGRYVEFNLIYDKGTKFGLESDGRIESILVSLPKTAGWEYNFVPDPGSDEAHTLAELKKGQNWIG